MGLPEVWKLLGDGDIITTAQLATEHFSQTGQPLRIAVDEAGWRFNNLNEYQVKAIREKSGELAFQGIEKQLFWRIARLLKQNIQLLFVFDGTRRPWKHGKTAGRIDYKSRELTVELLDAMRVPHHRAPAEAEAECVRLQRLGVVDAVWSEDADALMFGCDFLIRDYRESKKKGEKTSRSKAGTKKSNTHVRVIRPKHLLAAKIDKEGILLFAVVCGGDYDPGLKDCGFSTAMKMIKAGLATTLYTCQTDSDLAQWRRALFEFFETTVARRRVHIPNDYPKLKHVKNYRDPMVSADDQIDKLRGLRHGWDRPFDEEALRKLISERFNMWTKGYFNWIGPILLTRSLAISAEPTNTHAVRLTKRRPPKLSEAADADDLITYETKLTFSPFGLSSLGQNRFDDGYWTGKREEEFEPDHRVECEILECMLRRGLPEEVFDSSPKLSPKKRKRTAEKDEGDDFREGQTQPSAKKRKHKSTKKAVDHDNHISITNETGFSSISKPRPRFQMPPELLPASTSPTQSSASSRQPPTMTTTSYPSGVASANVISLHGSDEESENAETDDEDLLTAIRLSRQEERNNPTRSIGMAIQTFSTSLHGTVHENRSSSMFAKKAPYIHTIKTKYPHPAQSQISADSASCPRLFEVIHPVHSTSPGLFLRPRQRDRGGPIPDEAPKHQPIVANSKENSIIANLAIKDDVHSSITWNFESIGAQIIPPARNSVASRAEVLKTIQSLPAIPTAKSPIPRPNVNPSKTRGSLLLPDAALGFQSAIAAKAPTSQRKPTSATVPDIPSGKDSLIHTMDRNIASTEYLAKHMGLPKAREEGTTAKPAVPAAEDSPAKDAERIRAARMARFGVPSTTIEEPSTAVQVHLPGPVLPAIDTFYELPIPTTGKPSAKRRAPAVQIQIETIDLTDD